MSEILGINQGIEDATHPGGPWEYGHYIERYDGPADGDRGDDSLWEPLIYGEMTYDEALALHLRHSLDGGRITTRCRTCRAHQRAAYRERKAAR